MRDVELRAHLMPSSHIRWAVTTLLCLWVLANNVSARFTPVRHTLVGDPQSGEHGISVVLDGVERVTDPQLVLVGVVRNTGPSRLNLWVGVGDRTLGRVGIAPGTTAGISLAWARPDEIPARYIATLTGSAGTWTLEHLELTNVHRLARGAAGSLLILPARQPFGHVPTWWLIALIGCSLLLLAVRPPSWSLRLLLMWRLLSATLATALVAIAVSPLVSPFRVVLSPGIFAAGVLVLAAPRMAGFAPRLRTAATTLVTMADVFRVWAASIGIRLAAVPWLPLLGGLAVAAYSLFLVTHMGAYAAGADSSGYMNNARLLAQGRVSTPLRVVPELDLPDLPPSVYQPIGFRWKYGSEEMAPTYPIGLPIAVLTTAQLTGWSLAPPATMVWHALLGLGLMFWLGRAAGLSRGLSALGVLILGTSAQYVFSSLTFMSDTPALVWTTAAVLLAWRSRDDARVAALAGAAFAMAVMVRPTNALALAPIAVCLGWSPTRWAWWCAGGAPGAGVQFLYNWSAYGHPLQTGYGAMGSAFGVANVAASLRNYTNWLPVLLTPLVFLAAGLPLLWRRSPRLVTVLLLWIFSFGAVYALYDLTYETWWYLRFVLPAFPPLIAGALMVARRLLDLWPWSGSPVWRRRSTVLGGIVLAAFVLGHNIVWDGRLQASGIGEGERVYFEAAEWARAHVPRGSAILAMQTGGALFYYTDFTVMRWDRISRDQCLALMAQLSARKVPVYAVLFPFEVDERGVLSNSVPGTWTLVESVRHISVWRYDGPPGP